MEEELNQLNNNRIVTIKSANSVSYRIKKLDHIWSDYMIEELAKEIFDPILSRFEILDL